MTSTALKLLNVGCGPKVRAHGFAGFETWQEVRLDIDTSVEPDVVRPAVFDLWMLASKTALTDEAMRALAAKHLPNK